MSPAACSISIPDGSCSAVHLKSYCSRFPLAAFANPLNVPSTVPTTFNLVPFAKSSFTLTFGNFISNTSGTFVTSVNKSVNFVYCFFKPNLTVISFPDLLNSFISNRLLFVNVAFVTFDMSSPSSNVIFVVNVLSISFNVIVFISPP